MGGGNRGRAERVKIDLVETQGKILVMTSACTATHKVKDNDYKDRTGLMKIEPTYTRNDRLVTTVDYKDRTEMMKIELTYTQIDRLVMTVVCSAKGIGGGNRVGLKG